MGTQNNNTNDKNNNKKDTKTKKIKFSRPVHKPSDVRSSGNGNNSSRGS